MASRFLGSCSPLSSAFGPLYRAFGSGRIILLASLVACLNAPLESQIRLKPPEPGDPVTILPSDMAIFEAGAERKDLPCVVTQRKAELGFDLRFHAGYDVNVPLSEVSGDSGELTVVFRIFAEGQRDNPTYFVQHFSVPSVAEDAKGDALLQGEINLGEGSYHVDWLMRDRAERICSSSWDVDAALTAKDRPINLFLAPNKVSEAPPEPFVNDTETRNGPPPREALNVKLLVNFSPQDSLSAAM